MHAVETNSCIIMSLDLFITSRVNFRENSTHKKKKSFLAHTIMVTLTLATDMQLLLPTFYLAVNIILGLNCAPLDSN